MFPGGSLLRASSLPYAWLDPRVRVRDRCFVQLISVRSCVYTKCRRNPRVVEKREKGKGGRERKKEKKSATVTRHHQGREESRAEVRKSIVSKEKRKKERRNVRRRINRGAIVSQRFPFPFSDTQRRSRTIRERPTRTRKKHGGESRWKNHRGFVAVRFVAGGSMMMAFRTIISFSWMGLRLEGYK